jgi:hypothetical protein
LVSFLSGDRRDTRSGFFSLRWLEGLVQPVGIVIALEELHLAFVVHLEALNDVDVEVSPGFPSRSLLFESADGRYPRRSSGKQRASEKR